jgi:hypothetical protein
MYARDRTTLAQKRTRASAVAAAAASATCERPRLVDDELWFNEPQQAGAVEERYGRGRDREGRSRAGSPDRCRLEQRRAAPVERRVGDLGVTVLRGDPRRRLLDERMHLREQRPRRRALALERVDPLQPP